MPARRHLAVVAGLALAFAPRLPAEDASAFSAGIGDDYFAAGASVVLQDLVPGDALLAGGSIESNASIGGDASIVGGQVSVRATVGDDLYVAGGTVEVDALVNGNARIAGGRAVVAPETRVDGAAAIAGGTVDVRGRFGRYLTVAGGEVTLGGEIDGDVNIYARELRVLPGTRIGGRLVYRTAAPVDLPADLRVGGGVFAGDGTAGAEEGTPPAWDAGSAARGIGWAWLAGLFGVGLLLVLAFAGFSARTTRALTGRAWFGMGIGFLVLVSVPAAAVALVFTLIGIPLALIMMFAYLAMLVGAYVVGALYLGDLLLARTRPDAAVTPAWRLGALLVVLLALALVSALPLVGGLARFAVLLLGLGGLALAGWGETGGVPVPSG
jgi:hypothetical protein